MHCCCYGHTANPARWSELAVQLMLRRFKIIVVRPAERVCSVCCCSDTANRAELSVLICSQVGWGFLRFYVCRIERKCSIFSARVVGD
jgi:hypothetical protein